MAHWLVSRLGGHVGVKRGHYVWLSPDETYRIDLTGEHTSHWCYDTNNGYRRVDGDPTERAGRFSKRADRIFEGLPHLIHLGLDYAGDSHPAEEPQADDDSDRFNDSWTDPAQYWHDEPNPATPEGVYQFVYAGGQLEVSPNHSHAELSDHAGIDPAIDTGPFAAGHVVVTSGNATWEVQSNVNLHAFFKILKDATKNYGWQWGGMTDAGGQPIIETFAPKKSTTTLHYVYTNDHLYIGAASVSLLALSAQSAAGRPLTGTVRVSGSTATVDPDRGGADALPALCEWAADTGLTLYAGNNVIKTIPDLQEGNNYDPQTLTSPNPVEPNPPDERLPSGLYTCPGCSRLFPDWGQYSKHRPQCAEWANRDNPQANGDNDAFPSPDPGIYGDGAHFTEQRQEPGITTGSVVVLPARSWREAARVDGFARYATAFRYDNDDWRFYVAYRNGDPLGYAVMGLDGNIQMMHSAVQNQGIGSALYNHLTKHFHSMYTHAAHDKTSAMLKDRGWIQAKGQLWRWSRDDAPKDMIDAPVPFIYDVDKDKLFIGNPGARTSDIPGKFTPGGIVEGSYEPGGKVVIRSLTSTPYTIRHLVQLWYYTHPHMEVKSVHLKDDQGKDTRLAASNNVLMMARMDPAADAAYIRLASAGAQVYVVGGAVRDAILGRDIHDIDLLASGLNEDRVYAALTSAPGKVVREGKDFPVYHFTYKGSTVQVAVPRAERSTGPKHTDFEVISGVSVREDLERRDFTVNAMAVNLHDGGFQDPFNGTEDLAHNTLRTLTSHSLSDDPLRLLRGIVAHARFGLTPDPATLAQMTSNAGGLEHLPAERIRAELDKLFESSNPVAGIRLAHDVGALHHIFPEVEAAWDYDQNNPHHELILGQHLIKVLERVAAISDDRDLRLAALLHDIGKPGSAWTDPETGKNHYYAKLTEAGMIGANHEELGAEMTRTLLTRLRYPNDRIDRITALVAHHMYAGFTTATGARRFLARVGDHHQDLFTLRWADQGGKDIQPHQAHDKAWDVTCNRRLVAKVIDQGEATSTRDLAVNGHDLIAVGFTPGPQLGAALMKLTHLVIEDPNLNQRDTLLSLAQAYDTLGEEHGSQEPTPSFKDSGGQAQARAHHASDEGLGEDPQGESQAQVEPGWLDPEPAFPELPDAQAAHAAAMAQYGEQPYHIRDQAALESALGAPQNHYWGMFGQIDSQASPDPHERLLEAAAKMGYGIGESQPFINGNKRTARALVEQFLQSNELPHVTPGHDDEEYADHLRGYGIRLCPTDAAQLDANGQCPTCGQVPADGGQQRHALQQTIDMFKQRHHSGGPDLNYVSPYPDDDEHF